MDTTSDIYITIHIWETYRNLWIVTSIYLFVLDIIVMSNCDHNWLELSNFDTVLIPAPKMSMLKCCDCWAMQFNPYDTFFIAGLFGAVTADMILSKERLGVYNGKLYRRRSVVTRLVLSCNLFLRSQYFDVANHFYDWAWDSGLTDVVLACCFYHIYISR